MTDSPPPASLRRRLASLFYDSLLVAALLFFASIPFMMVSGPALASIDARRAFQAYITAILAAYLIYCWTRSGQTPGMKTWKLQVVGTDGKPPSLGVAMLRFAAALTLWAGIGVIWVFFDADRRFLHDRLAGTRVIRKDA